MARPKRDPRTKEEILNRMLSYDFDGDIRNLGAEPASIVRTGAHTLRLTFPATGTVFDVSIHRPREFAQKRAVPAAQPQSSQRPGRATVEPVPGMAGGEGARTARQVRRRKGESIEDTAARRRAANA